MRQITYNIMQALTARSSLNDKDNVVRVEGDPDSDGYAVYELAGKPLIMSVWGMNHAADGSAGKYITTAGVESLTARERLSTQANVRMAAGVILLDGYPMGANWYKQCPEGWLPLPDRVRTVEDVINNMGRTK